MMRCGQTRTKVTVPARVRSNDREWAGNRNRYKLRPVHLRAEHETIIMVADAAAAKTKKPAAHEHGSKRGFTHGDRQKMTEYILFDGTCALCHGFVTFVLKRDRGPQPFHFAPLQGEYVKKIVPEEVRSRWPDSVVVLDAQGQPRTQSAAVIYVLRRLGGFWSFAGGALRLVPPPLRDAGYRMMASVRKKIFGTKDDLCPIIPAEWRGRFEM
jgi:predicted DCC family thiol-disulfide oxidoreductase YuxK